MPRNPTERQLSAIREKSKTLLVAAAAGSGKTWTLTERIIDTILDEDLHTDLDELLIVTFTTAAAGELRERIGAALRDALAERPSDARLSRQLLSLGSASIYTIDAFCNDILRRNTDAAGLPPNYRVPDTAEVQLLASSVMESLIDGLYEGAYQEEVSGDAFAALSDCLTDARGENEFADTLLYLYHKTESHEQGVHALHALVAAYELAPESGVEQSVFVRYLCQRARDAAQEFLPRLSELSHSVVSRKDRVGSAYEALLSPLRDLLQGVLRDTTYRALRARLTAYTFESIPALKNKEDDVLALDRLYGTIRQEFKKLIETYFTYTEDELRSLFRDMRDKMSTLVGVLCIFDRLYRAEKRRLGVCEYADMERYAYECLWQDGKRTPLAEALRSQYKGVYIDEYQDVNRLQDRIFAAVSTDTNRFMVGDIKQSIYGFRSADPSVFAAMKTSFVRLDECRNASCASLYMSENFRCDRVVIDTVNELFDAVFGAVGDTIGYLPDDRLIFAKGEPASALRTSELLLVEVPSRSTDATENEDDDDLAAEGRAQLEAHALAKRIRDLLADGNKNDGSPLEPSDIAILFRSARKNIPLFSEVLASYGIPCTVTEPTEFFLNAEILLTLCLLNTIDNPSKDIYLAGLLCSPLFGFTADDLVNIRRASHASTLFESLRTYAQSTSDAKCNDFLSRLTLYRRLAEGTPMDALLFRLYRETGLLSLATQHGGRDNLLLLYEYARSFERSSYRGLYAFISYINRLIERRTAFDRSAERDSARAGVHLMSVHASKGLEFPVVCLAGCGRSFSRQDMNRKLLYAQDFGLALRLRDESGLSFVDNPVRAVVADRMYQTMLEEELRILYVAMTRAREQLILSGTAGPSATELVKDIRQRALPPTPYSVRHMRSFLELLIAATDITVQRHIIPYAPSAADMPPETEAVPPAVENQEDIALRDTLLTRFAYAYPHPALTTLPEKLSVSALFPAVLDGTEDTPSLTLDAKAPPAQADSLPLPPFFTGKDKQDSAERGIATHTFLQFCDLHRLAKDGVSAELTRLTKARFLSESTASLVRLDELERFRTSHLCSELLHAKQLYRELRFHVQLPAAHFTEDPERRAALNGARILVQGVMDCVYEDAHGALHLIDYKTDRLSRAAQADVTVATEELRAKHRSQLSYYREAICHMFGKAPSTVRIYSLALGDTVDME